MSQDNSTIYGNVPYPGESRGSYSNERTEMLPGSQPAYPGDNTQYASQPQQQYYNQPQQQPYNPQQYNMGYNAARNRQQKKKSGNTLLWVAIFVSLIAIGAAVTVIALMMSDKNDAPVQTAMTDASGAANASAVTTAPAAPSRAAEPAAEPAYDAPKSTSSSGLGTGYAASAMQGMFAGTSNGESSSSLPGKAGSMGRGSYKRITSGGVTYSYVFKHGDVRYDDNQALTSVSLEVSGVSSPWDECDAFDSYMESNGATLAASTGNGRRIYRTPAGYYASSGYVGRKFVVYFYYELFENSVASNAAPRK